MNETSVTIYILVLVTFPIRLPNIDFILKIPVPRRIIASSRITSLRKYVKSHETSKSVPIYLIEDTVISVLPATVAEIQLAKTDT